MLAVDDFRSSVMRQVSSVPSFGTSWNTFQHQIDSLIGPTPNANQIFDLGQNISTIFLSNSKKGRSQSAVASGGAAWECFITWYLNLVFWGTDVIASRQNKKFIPQVLYDAFSVTISNQKTNTESDIVVYSIPNIKNITKLSLKDIDNLIRSNITLADTSVVQCKTNWNDNAQIPMLWDLIYNSTNFRLPNVSVGTAGVNPIAFKSFAYAYFTVPTNKNIQKIKPKSTQVLRVANLTGGNYWGRPTTNGIAQSVNNYFGRNFANHFIGGVQAHIASQIKNDPDYYSRFRTLNF